MVRNKMQGVWPAMMTPLTNGKPNVLELEKLTELLITQGLDGLYILGSTGQGVLLSESDRKLVTEVVASVNNGRLPIIVQVGSLTTEESIRLATHAAQHQIDGISSVGPIYYQAPGGSSSMALNHYKAIAKATDLPFFPYQLGQNAFSERISDFVQKLLELPNITGMKLTTANLLEIVDIFNHSDGKLILFSGADELMCQAALCGTSGAIGTTYNLWGQECQYVRNEFLKGNVALATQFMLAFQEVISTILPNVWTFFRLAMKTRFDIDIGSTVAPLGSDNEAWGEDEIIALMEKITEISTIKKVQ